MISGQLHLWDPRPILVDGCCCAGGATKGYQQAGFYVVGIDIDPQPNYCGDEFVQGDVVAFLEECVARGNRLLDGRSIAAYHVSPPCQKFSAMTACRPGLADEYPDLVEPLRQILEASGLPYVMENVPRSPLRADLVLCGQMFGLDLYRHRIFESNVPLEQPAHPKHVIPASRAGHWVPGTIMSISGNVAPVAEARRVMEIDWTTRHELAESIPPRYSRFIGEQLLAHITLEAAA